MRMLRRTSPWWVAVGVAAMVSGCTKDSTGPSDPLQPGTEEIVALLLLEVDATAGTAAAVASDARTGSREIDRVADCPAGGTRSLTGSFNSSLDQETRVFSTRWTSTLAHDECAFAQRGRDGSVTVTIDGSVTATGNASYQLPAERGGRRTILSYDATRVGSTTTTVGDRSRTCRVNVTETYVPATQTFHVSGTVCGREINLTRGPGAARDG